MSTPISAGSREQKNRARAMRALFCRSCVSADGYLQRLNEPTLDFRTLPFGASGVGLYVVFTYM